MSKSDDDDILEAIRAEALVRKQSLEEVPCDPSGQWVPDGSSIEDTVAVRRTDTVGEGLALSRHVRFGRTADGSLGIELSEYLNGKYTLGSGRMMFTVDAETAKPLVEALAKMFTRLEH